jgi:hypothetical protein
VWNVVAPGTTLGAVGRQNIPDKVKKLSNVIIPDAVKDPITAGEAGAPQYLPEPTATSTPEPTPTPQPATGAQAQYAAYAGHWVGTWTNTTFGTSGPLDLTIEVMANGTARLTIDAGGMVGGLLDPPPLSSNGGYDATAMSFAENDDANFGVLTASITAAGGLSIAVPSVPVVGMSMQATGAFSGTVLDGTYEVSFIVGSPADGVFSLTKQ